MRKVRTHIWKKKSIGGFVYPTEKERILLNALIAKRPSEGLPLSLIFFLLDLKAGESGNRGTSENRYFEKGKPDGILHKSYL